MSHYRLFTAAATITISLGSLRSRYFFFFYYRIDVTVTWIVIIRKILHEGGEGNREKRGSVRNASDFRVVSSRVKYPRREIRANFFSPFLFFFFFRKRNERCRGAGVLLSTKISRRRMTFHARDTPPLFSNSRFFCSTCS